MTIQPALTFIASGAMRTPLPTMYLDIYHDKILFILKLIARNLGLFIYLFIYLFKYNHTNLNKCKNKNTE